MAPDIHQIDMGLYLLEETTATLCSTTMPGPGASPWYVLFSSTFNSTTRRMALANSGVHIEPIRPEFT